MHTAIVMNPTLPVHAHDLRVAIKVPKQRSQFGGLRWAPHHKANVGSRSDHDIVELLRVMFVRGVNYETVHEIH